MSTIDYSLLAKAILFYENAGFKRIEVPWRVTTDILGITKPPGCENKDYIIQGTDKGLLASGEQGFLYLANKGVLPPGKYQTLTPCFRNETHDRHHSKQFMKLELIDLLTPSAALEFNENRLIQQEVEGMANLAKRAFMALKPNSYLHNKMHIINAYNDDPVAMPASQQRDIVITMESGDVELGSYGARKTSFAAWVYGTGLAEPRFSKAMLQAMFELK